MTNRNIIPYNGDNLPTRESRYPSPIQQWALELFVQGLIHENPLTTKDLTTAFGGLATMADSGLAHAIQRFLAINDPHRAEPLYAYDPFKWEIEGDNGFVGTISNISEAVEVGTDGLQVYNIAVMPFPSSIGGGWYDHDGNPAQEDYGDTLRGFVQLDPLLLVHVDPYMNRALLDLQRVVSCDLLDIAGPIVRTDVECHSGDFGRIWGYSGPIGLLSETPPPFTTLPGGDIYLYDGHGRSLGDRSFLSIAKPGDIGPNLQKLDSLVKRTVGEHLTNNTTVEKLVPQGLLGGLFGKQEWRTTTFPSPMSRLQSSCAQLQHGLTDLGIDPITAAASAYSWLIGMKCAAKNVGIYI